MNALWCWFLDLTNDQRWIKTLERCKWTTLISKVKSILLRCHDCLGLKVRRDPWWWGPLGVAYVFQALQCFLPFIKRRWSLRRQIFMQLGLIPTLSLNPNTSLSIFVAMSFYQHSLTQDGVNSRFRTLYSSDQAPVFSEQPSRLTEIPAFSRSRGWV